jgi:hypothetical protein
MLISKAFNVEAARLLGWIKTAKDIKNEFVHEHLDNAEMYFKSNISIDFKQTLLIGN